MLLNLSIYDAANRPRGSVRMKLDFAHKRWSVVQEDARHAWQWVGFSQQGPFEQKDWGVIWLMDLNRNTVIFRDAPAGEGISKSGHARIYDPKDRAFKDGMIAWSSEPEAPAAPQAPAALSALRQAVLAKLPTILPAQYQSGNKQEHKNYTNNPFHVLPQDVSAGYTTCGEFPAYLMHLIGGKLGPGTYALQPQGERRNAWRNADGKAVPLPGDLYALCTGVTRDNTVAHIGVIVDTTRGTIWRTADWGQGAGFRGDFVDRAYDAAVGTLAGEVDPSKGNTRPPRALKGWVDLDGYFANTPAKP